MNEFITTYPPSIAGGAYRTPLDHYATERCGQRMEALYQHHPLEDNERGQLLKLYGDIKKADRYFFNVIGPSDLPHTNIRPISVNEERRPASEFFGRSTYEVCSGFVLRVLEYVERLEQKYSVKPGPAGSQVDTDEI